jgi:hypothetical protein
MPRERITRRQKNISRLLREKKSVQPESIKSKKILPKNKPTHRLKRI